MLDKNARKVLKYFIETNKNLYITDIETNLKLQTNLEKSSNLIQKAIDDLVETNCIKSSGYNIFGYVYKLTNHGKMYFKQNRRDWLKAILNGIVFPIIIALITALITTLTTIYLSKYKQDKQYIEIQCNYKNDSLSNP